MSLSVIGDWLVCLAGSNNPANAGFKFLFSASVGFPFPNNAHYSILDNPWPCIKLIRYANYIWYTIPSNTLLFLSSLHVLIENDHH